MRLMRSDIQCHMGYDDGAARWLCLKCNDKSNPRWNRMHDHVAKCLGYKLYLCEGGCGVDSWYELFLFNSFGRLSRAKDHS